MIGHLNNYDRLVRAGTYITDLSAFKLEGYWPCDERSGTTVFDRSGNGRNGSYVNGAGGQVPLLATELGPGMDRRVVTLLRENDDAGPYISIPDDAIWDSNNQTVAFWFRVRLPVDLTKVIYMYSRSGSFRGGLTATGALEYFNVPANYTTTSSVSQHSDPRDGRWHHWALSHRSGLQTLYLDGRKVGHTTDGSNHGGDTDPLFFGRRDGASANFPLSGSIAHITFHSWFMQDVQINKLYHGMTQRFRTSTRLGR